MSKLPHTDDWWHQLITEAQSQGFFGKLTLQFERGHITLVRKEETIQPPKGTEALRPTGH